MQKLKEYKYIILIILLVLGFAFYWYSWRPSNIRSSCLAEAEFNRTAANNFDDAERIEFINNYYETCIKRFGLEK